MILIVCGLCFTLMFQSKQLCAFCSLFYTLTIPSPPLSSYTHMIFTCSHMHWRTALLNRKKTVRKLGNSTPTSPSISREYLWGGPNCLNVLYWQSGPKISCWRLGLSKQFLNAPFQCFLIHSILGRSKRVPDCSSPSCITEDVTGLPLGS